MGCHFCHIEQWHYSNHTRKEGRAVFSFEAQNSLPCFVEKFLFPPLFLSSIFLSWLMVPWQRLGISQAVCHLQLDTGYFKSMIHYKGQNRQFCVRASAWMENKSYVLTAPAGESNRGLAYFPRLFSVPRFQSNTFFLPSTLWERVWHRTKPCACLILHCYCLAAIRHPVSLGNVTSGIL